MQTRFTASASSSAAVTVVAAATLVTALPAAAQSVPAPQVAARSWMLTDVTSGQVLAGANMDERIEPASLTKLMTAYLVFEAVRDGKLKYDQMITPTETVRTVKTDESRMFLEPGKPASVREMTQGLIVQSGNDAALVLAEDAMSSNDAALHRSSVENVFPRLGRVRSTDTILAALTA